MAFRDIVGHQRPIEWLQTAVKSKHLGHAYLFHGEPTIGKRLTALALAQLLHCDAPQDSPSPDACGTCQSCYQIDQASHPDFLTIRPEDENKQNPKIKVDQIRDIEHLVIYRPLIGSHKICLIDDADTMTQEAANALLKTLEDPPDHCLFLLITNQPENLLLTIHSRCITLRFSPISLNAVYEFLLHRVGMESADAQLVTAFSAGRLGSAIELNPAELKVKRRQYWDILFGEQPISTSRAMNVSEDLIKADQVQEAIHWFWLGLRDLLHFTFNPSSPPLIYQDQESIFRRLAQQMTSLDVLRLINELQQIEKGYQRNLNLQIGLEQFFFHLGECMKPSLSHDPG